MKKEAFTPNQIYNFLKNNFWLILLLLIFLLFCTIYCYKIFIDLTFEGDFGRDLYYYSLLARNQLPYVDFNWIYGPLAPLAYGFIFKIAGISFFNALTLWYIIFGISLFLMYYLVFKFSNSFYAFLAGVMLLGYYSLLVKATNHIFGLLFIILVITFLYIYIQKKQTIVLVYMTLSCFALAMTKLNMALIVIIPLYVCLFIMHRSDKAALKKQLIAAGILFISIITFYGLIVYVLPGDELAKNFPYLGSYRMTPSENLFDRLMLPDYIVPLFTELDNYTLLKFYRFISLNLWYFVFIAFALITVSIIFRKEGGQSGVFWFPLILLAITILSIHEFVIAGTVYSLRYWTLPVIIPLVFYCIQYFKENYAQKITFRIIYTTIMTLLIAGLSIKLYTMSLYSIYPSIYLNYERVKINVIQNEWSKFFVEVSNYIDTTIPEGEKVLSLPYNSLYNFINDHPQPGRESEFMYLSALTKDDQQEIIQDINHNHVQYIVQTLKHSKKSRGIGTFGKTHCQMLKQYIDEHYSLNKVFYWYGGGKIVFIYKRKIPFTNK